MALGKRKGAQLFAGIVLIGLLLVSAPATACLANHHGNMMGSAARLPQDAVVSPSDHITVEIKGYDFAPRDLTVFAGATITWVNRDDVPHDATSEAGGWGIDILNPGQEGTLAFDEPGTFDYLCRIHPYMKAKLVVRPDSAVANVPGPGGVSRES